MHFANMEKRKKTENKTDKKQKASAATSDKKTGGGKTTAGLGTEKRQANIAASKRSSDSLSSASKQTKAASKDKTIGEVYSRAAAADEQSYTVVSAGKDKQQKTLSRRVTKQVLKTLFIRIPVAVIIFLIAALVFLKFYLTPQRAEALLTDNFGALFNGSISANVKEFSPYGGFVMEGIKIYNGPDFDNSLFVSIDKLVLKYDLPAVLTGSLRIHEVGVYKPRVYITEKNGVWNVEAFVKSSEETEKPEDKGGGLERIYSPIAIDAFCKIALDDLNVSLKGDGINAFVNGFSLSADLLVPPVHEIPLSLEALTLPEVLNVKINPAERLGFSLQTKDVTVSPSVLLTLLVDWREDEKKFISSFKCGTDKTPVQLQGTKLAPLDILVSYNMFYSPDEDKLNLEHLRVKFGKDTWIDIGGTISNVTKEPYINISMKESLIDLKKLYPYYARIMDDRSTMFSGVVSLFPADIQGTLSSLSAAGSLVLKNGNLRLLQTGTEFSVPAMNLDYNAKLRGRNIAAAVDLKVPHLYYTLKGTKSGDNGLRLTADANVINFGKQIEINSLEIRAYSPQTGADAARVKLSGNVDFSDGILGNVNITNIYGNPQPLQAMLMPRVAQKINSLPIKQPVNLSLASQFRLNDEQVSATADTLLKVPDFAVDDLKLSANAVYNFSEKRINLSKLTLSSAAWNGRLDVSGRVDMKEFPISDSDVKLSLRIKAPEERKIYDDIRLAGLVNIDAAMKGDLNTGKASGAVKFQGFSMSSVSRQLAIKDLNLDFPFAYLFKARHGDSSLSVGKSQVIDNDYFRQSPNFTIASISAKHPVRDVPVEYIKNFEAFMAFQDNIFQISDVKSTVLDGSLYGKRVLFDIADLRRRNMEYVLEIDATDIDINRLDNPNQKEKTRDAELSLNANFSGRGVDINRELNVTGYINIHKIGNNFANSLMKGLSETEGKSVLGVVQPVIDNTMSVKAFNLNLDKGMVYATVTLNRRIMSYVFGITIQENKINFERIPAQEYLRKVREEARENN